MNQLQILWHFLPNELQELCIKQIADFHIWCIARLVCKKWLTIIIQENHQKLFQFVELSRDSIDRISFVLPNKVRHGLTTHYEMTCGPDMIWNFECCMECTYYCGKLLFHSYTGRTQSIECSESFILSNNNYTINITNTNNSCNVTLLIGDMIVAKSYKKN